MRFENKSFSTVVNQYLRSNCWNKITYPLLTDTYPQSNPPLIHSFYQPLHSCAHRGPASFTHGWDQGLSLLPKHKTYDFWI